MEAKSLGKINYVFQIQNNTDENPIQDIPKIRTWAQNPEKGCSSTGELFHWTGHKQFAILMVKADQKKPLEHPAKKSRITTASYVSGTSPPWRQVPYNYR